MRFVNLTPHPINLHLPDGSVQTFAPSGTVARAAETRFAVGTIDGVAVELVSFGAVDGLPTTSADTFYIVSGLILSAVPTRADVLAPGQPVRDDQGRVVGCKGWTCTPAFAQPQPPPPAGDDAPRTSPAMPPSYRAWQAAPQIPYAPTAPETVTVSRLRWNGVGMEDALPREFRVGAATYWCAYTSPSGTTPKAWRDGKGRPMSFVPVLKRGEHEEFSPSYDESARARALAFAEAHNFPADNCAGSIPASAEKFVGEDGTVRYELYTADGRWIMGRVQYGTYTIPITKTVIVSDQKARENAALMDEFISDMGMLSEKD